MGENDNELLDVTVDELPDTVATEEWYGTIRTLSSKGLFTEIDVYNNNVVNEVDQDILKKKSKAITDYEIMGGFNYPRDKYYFLYSNSGSLGSKLYILNRHNAILNNDNTFK